MGPAGFFSCVGCPWVERWTGTTLSHQHTAQRTSHTSPHQACLVGPGPPWPKYRTRLLGRWSCTFANSRAWEPAQLWSCLCCYSTQSTWLPRVSTPTRLYASGKGHPIQHSHGIHRVRWGRTPGWHHRSLNPWWIQPYSAGVCEIGSMHGCVRYLKSRLKSGVISLQPRPKSSMGNTEPWGCSDLCKAWVATEWPVIYRATKGSLPKDFGAVLFLCWLRSVMQMWKTMALLC